MEVNDVYARIGRLMREHEGNAAAFQSAVEALMSSLPPETSEALKALNDEMTARMDAASGEGDQEAFLLSAFGPGTPLGAMMDAASPPPPEESGDEVPLYAGLLFTSARLALQSNGGKEYGEFRDLALSLAGTLGVKGDEDDLTASLVDALRRPETDDPAAAVARMEEMLREHVMSSRTPSP